MSEFRQLLVESRLRTICGAIERAVAGAAEPTCPRYWRDAIDDYQRALHRHVTRSDFFVPIEFEDRSPEVALARARSFVGQFGEIMLWWPEMWAVARRMNAELRGP